MKSMTLISVLLLAVLLPTRTESQPGSVATQEAIVAVPEPVQEETPEETWNKFVGQKVIFVKVNPKRYGSEGFHRFGQSGKSSKENKLVAQYAGKTGVISEVVTEQDKDGSWKAFVVTLDDTAEKVVALKPHLGFFEEMDIVKSYIGKSLWSGGLNLVKDYTIGMRSNQIKANSFLVKDGERLLVTRAEWGDDSCSMYLCFKTLSGQEGCLSCGDWDDKYSDSFYITKKFGHGSNFYLRDFYFDDPLTGFQTPDESVERLAVHLTRLTGEWEASGSFNDVSVNANLSGNTLSNLSVGFSRKTVSGKTVIEQPDPHTITFPLSNRKVTLKLDPASKRYLLSINPRLPFFDDVALVYCDKEGFVTAGPLKGGREVISARISFDDQGGHTWQIRSGNFRVTFAKPKEGEKKSL